MKKLLLLLIPVYCFGQTGYDPKPVKTWFKDTVLMTKQLKINSTGGAIIGGYNKNADAILELSSTTKTFLPPRMTAVQRLAISPTAGAVVYDTDSSKICYYNGSWICLSNTGGSGGVTTNGNGTTINGTAVDLRGNLNRAATDLKFNFTNQSLSLVDTSVNAYSFGIGNVDADGVARMLGNMQSAELLATDNVLLSSGLTADGNTYILGEDKQWLLVATTNYNHSNVIIDTSGISLRSGSTVTANKKLYFDLNKVSSDAIRMGVGIGTMFDSATSQVWMDYSLENGAVWRGVDRLRNLMVMTDSAGFPRFQFTCSGNWYMGDISDGLTGNGTSFIGIDSLGFSQISANNAVRIANSVDSVTFQVNPTNRTAVFRGDSLLLDIGSTEGAGKVLTSDAAGNATWQAASGGAFTVSNDVTTGTRLYPVYTTGTGSVTPYIGTTKHTYYPLTGKGTWGTDSLQERATDVYNLNPETLYYKWNFNNDTNGRAIFKIGNKAHGNSVTTNLILGDMDSAKYVSLESVPLNTSTYGVKAGYGFVSSGSGMVNGMVVQADNGDLILNTSAFSPTYDLVVNQHGVGSANPARNSFIGMGTGDPRRPLTLYQPALPIIALQNTTSGNDSLDGFQIQTSGSDAYLYNYESGFIRANSTFFGLNVDPVRALSVYHATLPVMALYNSTSGSTTTDGFQVQTSGTDTYLWQYENDDIHIGTNATERMVIGNAGAVRMNAYGAGTATFDASGNITSVSDERLKKIKGVYKSGLKELLGVEPIIYKWNEKSGLEQKYNYAGFSAQNVKENIPLGTGENSEGYLSLQDRAILATLVNAVKELSAEIEKLKKK